MAYHIGRKYNVGIGKEVTRGTAVAADYWLPKMVFTHDDKIDVVVDESSIGIIEDAQSQDVVGKHSEGTITGRIADTSFGLWLLSTLGTEAAPALVPVPREPPPDRARRSRSHPSGALVQCRASP